MKSDYTHITVVLDRSGSMAGIREEAENGLNRFVDEQKLVPGRATFTFVKFDDQYEVVYNGIDLKEVSRLTLEPRGWTALLDTVGKAIVDTGEFLRAIPEDDRPGLVLFVILTDGQENHSREYALGRVKEMIEEQQSVWKWQFNYLGANQDAFRVAGGMGIPVAAAANYDPKNVVAGFTATSDNAKRMRAARAGGQSVVNAYTPEEHRMMVDPQK